MIAIKNLASMPAYLLFFYTIFLVSNFSGCIEPNTEDLWSISVDQILQTNGYARDVKIDNDIVFVAAGEAGAQIWNLNNSNNPSLLSSIPLHAIGASKEISQIYFSPINNLIHLLEYNERSYVFLLDDSLYNVQSFGQYGAEDTRDFVIIDSTDSFTCYTVIKKDQIIKWLQWEKTNFGDQIIWGDGSYDGEIPVNAVPSSISLSNRTIVLGVGQLGIQIWQIESIYTDPIFHYSIDLNGAVQSVELVNENNLYVASGNYGAYYLPLDEMEVDADNNVINHDAIIHFAKDLTVDHISINNGIAVLSLGSKGIALYDVTEPSLPIEKGIFPVGYTYKSQFWGEKLVVCSREGLQILTIEK
jgi:hypothetical protein